MNDGTIKCCHREKNGHTDPVCGMAVDPTREPSPPTREYEGTAYFFCSKTCASKFEMSPDRYLANGPDKPLSNLTSHTTG